MQKPYHKPASLLIAEIVSFFEDHVRDKSSLVEIKACLNDCEFGTQRARNIFDNVRQKSLKAEKKGWQDTLVQRAFEEACAKAMYNFGRPNAPYDPDAQFWIVPCAFKLSDTLQLSQEKLLNILLSAKGHE